MEDKVKVTRKINRYVDEHREFPIRKVHPIPTHCDLVSDEQKYLDGEHKLVSTFVRKTKIKDILHYDTSAELTDVDVEGDMVYTDTYKEVK